MIEYLISGGSLALQIVAGLLFADFVSGIIHWFEDRYGDPKWPIIGHAISMNREHHRRPRYFLVGTVWTRNREVFVVGLLLLLVFVAADAINPFTLSGVAFGMLANEFHAAAHRFPQENPLPVRLLQMTGVIQSKRVHGQHHRGDRDTHYCVMTAYLNPVLDRFVFFRAVEAFVRVTTGITPMDDERAMKAIRVPT